MSKIVKTIGISVITVGIILMFLTIDENTNQMFDSGKISLSPQQTIDNMSVLVSEIVVMCFGIGIFAIGIRMNKQY